LAVALAFFAGAAGAATGAAGAAAGAFSAARWSFNTAISADTLFFFSVRVAILADSLAIALATFETTSFLAGAFSAGFEAGFAALGAAFFAVAGYKRTQAVINVAELAVFRLCETRLLGLLGLFDR
jgi:hypothetical protein